MAENSWIRLPLDLIQKVSKTALIVWAIIADKGNMQTVRITEKELAAAVCCTVRTVRTALQELESKELLSVSRDSGLCCTPAPLLVPKRQKMPVASASASVPVVRGARPLLRQIAQSSISAEALADLQEQLESKGVL